MYIMKKGGRGTEPYGTTECIIEEVDVVNPTRTWKVLEVRNYSIHFSVPSYSIFMKFVGERLV